MTSPQETTDYKQLKEIFSAALDLATEDRAAFLDEHCPDKNIRIEVESLLEAHDEAGRFLEDVSAVRGIEDSLDKTDKFIGQKIDKYTVERAIGRGGMGAVYLASRSAGDFKKLVAVKIIKHGADSDENLKRFGQERQILAALEHPNIARLIDGGTTADGTPYLLMEYVEGAAIDEFCARNNLSVEAKLRLFQKICAAVAHAHRNLTIHRDLKSANILVRSDGEPKLLDFGIAKLFSNESNQTNIETITGFRALTPDYASPEQLRGEKLTTATDVYSLGVILYELLTGARPFATGGKNFAEVLQMISEIQPPRPSLAKLSTFTEVKTKDSSGEINPKSKIQNPKSVNSDIDNIVLKSLSKESERRYGSVEQFSEDIERYLKGLPVAARKDSFSYRFSKFVKRNTLTSAVSAMLILSLLSGFVITFWQYRKAQAAQARAERRFNDVRGLTNSLVFELNDDIEKGPTRARQKLVAKALEYLDSLSQEAQTDDQLKREIGETYLRIGDIQGRAGHANLGDTASALISYRKASETLEPLIRNDAPDPEILISLSFAYENTGKIQTLGNEFALAVETQKKALEIRRKVLNFAPGNIKYRRFEAESLIRIGDSLQKITELTGNTENYPQVLENYQTALQTFEEIAILDPANMTYQTWQPTLRQRIGTLLEKWGKDTDETEKIKASIENHRQSLNFWRKLSAAAPEDEGFRTQIADEMTFIGIAQTDLGELKDAFENFRQAKIIFESIAAKDKENKEIFYDFVFLYQNLAAALAKNNEASEAIEMHQRALQIAETLLAENPARTNENYGFMVIGYHSVSELAEKQNNRAKALENSRREFEIRAKIMELAPIKTKLIESQKATAQRIANFKSYLPASKKVVFRNPKQNG
jgi:serine/threonine protein kinase